MMGALAAQAAAGLGGRTTDAKGAVEEVGRFDFGGVFLILLALGLAAYAVWRVAQAVLDLDDKGGGLEGYGARAGFFISGLIHIGLALTAAGIGVTSGSGSVRTWVARVLGEPGGVWAVGIAGAVVIGSAGYEFYKAWSAKFEKHFRQMSARAQTWSRAIGRFGLAARGVTFLIVGWFLIRAAWNVSSHEVKDIGGAMRVLQEQPYGAWLLGVVACGLISYGLLSFVNARYRRIL